MYIIFDTETTGLPKNYNAPVSDTDNWPRLVQLAWQVYDKDGNLLKSVNRLIKPVGFVIPEDAIKIHRITNERAQNEGLDVKDVISEFFADFDGSTYLIAHNIGFDEKIIGSECFRFKINDVLNVLIHIDTKELTTDFCKIQGGRGGRYKWPTLAELFNKLFDTGFDDAHDAAADVAALAKCFFELQRIGILGFKEEIKNDDQNLLFNQIIDKTSRENISLELKSFVPLGLHTFHSILEGAGHIDDYIVQAKKYNISAMAITDVNTMSGTFEFYKKCKEKNIKPILGIEMFINDSVEQNEDGKIDGEDYKIKIFIKNKEGYKNLNKLLYLANTKGFYNGKSRISEKWLFDNKNGLMVSTSCIESKFSSLIQKGRENDAEKLLAVYYHIFGKDLISEIQFSSFQNQKIYNIFLIKMINKFNLLSVLSNNSYYLNKEDSRIQDIVTSIKQNRNIAFAKLKENRDLYFFSSVDFYELNKKYGFNYPDNFLDLCLNNTNKVSELCNYDFEIGAENLPKYEPTQDVISYFKTTDTKEIITKLSFAKLNQKLKKYQLNGLVKIDNEKIKEYYDRLNYELEVIGSRNALDYFLVYWELINDYRKQGYVIGPGRGSAAGSLLSWCLDITKIDPIYHGLYFERFLNPTRKSLPDIDIDFMSNTDNVTDDFLIKKYGKERVIPVGTFSTFNEKGCLKDVVRAIRGSSETGNDSDVAEVTREMPNSFFKYGYTLDYWFNNWVNDPKCSDRVRNWIKNPSNKEIIDITLKLQKKIRGIGKHAAGIVITPGPSWEYIPTNIITNNGTIVTAFQEADKSGKDLSELGILKLDRLKLDTLNIIEDTINIVKEIRGIDIKEKVEYVDLNDKNLFYELKLGLNHGIFQFESSGMNNLLKGINVEKFEEAVAANALYRPGAMGIGAHEEYIKNKFNPQSIKHEHEALKPILSDAHGVLIYQEQLMFIGHKIGGMSLGEADTLRRYMDKAASAIQK